MENVVLNLPVSLVLIFLLGFLGYRFFSFFHIPGGAIIGALVMVAAISSQGIGWAVFPANTGLVFQIIIGIVLGCKFGKEKVPLIKKLFIPGLFVAAWMIGISLAVAWLLVKVTGLELGTALYGSVPAGISEMSLIALSYNLNMPVVTLLQLVRAITVIIITPLIAVKYNNTQREEAAAKAQESADGVQDKQGKALDVLVTLAVGSAGGFTAYYVGIPAGGMLGAMMVVAALRIKGVRLKEIPRWIAVTAQIGLGGYLGTAFTTDVVGNLYNLLLPTLVFSSVIVLSGLVLGFIAHRIFGWDLATSLLACAAAGYTQMSIIAVEMEVDAVTVSIVQALRAVIILSVMPAVIVFIIR